MAKFLRLDSDPWDRLPCTRGIVAAVLLLGMILSQGGVASAQTSGTWTSTTSGFWSDSGNWSGGAIADGAGATASFTSDITAATTIGLDSSRTIGNLTFNDTVSPSFSTPWLLGNDGNESNILTLDVASGTPTITVGTSNRADISATLAGTQGLLKAGGGRLVLTGSNSYSGTTTLAAESGVLVLGHANALGGSTVVNITGNTSGVSVGNGVSTGAGATISLSGNASGVNNDGGLTALNSSGTWAGNVTLTSGRLGYREGNLVITGTVGGGNFVLSGWGDGKENTGSQYGVTLAGPSTYTGSTGLLRGWLRLGRDDALPTGTTLDVFTTANISGASQAATFDLNGFNQTVAVLQSTGLLNRNGYANGYVTNTSLTSGTLTVNQSTNSTYRGLLTGNVSLVKDGAGNLTLGPVFVTTGNSFVNGTNSFTGTTRVNGGTLTLSSGTTATSLALFGSTFDTDGAGTLAIDSGITAATFGGLAGSGTLALQTTAAGAVALSVGGGDASSTFAGTLTGPGSLVKIGTGTLTVSGATSDYAGGTTVSAGTLLVTNTAAIPGLTTSGSYSVAAGATLATGTAFDDATLEAMLGTGNFAANSVLGIDTAAGDRTFASSLSGTIGLSVTGGNRLTLSGSNQLGAIAVTNATLTISNTEGLLGSGAITVDGGTIEWNPGETRNYSFNGRTFTVTDSGATFRGVDAGNLTFGNLSGTGAVIFESGSGTLVTNANTYSGGTTIKPGATVAYTNDTGFGSGPLTIEGGRLRSTTQGSRTIGNDTTLAGDVDFFSLSSGNDRDLVFTGPMTIAGESRTVTVNMSPAAGSTGIFFNGPIDDDGAGLGLVKTGTSMLILGGANT
jgi:fibronectin-binding autotransporter adhesin